MPTLPLDFQGALNLGETAPIKLKLKVFLICYTIAMVTFNVKKIIIT